MKEKVNRIKIKMKSSKELVIPGLGLLQILLLLFATSGRIPESIFIAIPILLLILYLLFYGVILILVEITDNKH